MIHERKRLFADGQRMVYEYDVLYVPGPPPDDDVVGRENRTKIIGWWRNFWEVGVSIPEVGANVTGF